MHWWALRLQVVPARSAPHPMPEGKEISMFVLVFSCESFGRGACKSSRKTPETQ